MRRSVIGLVLVVGVSCWGASLAASDPDCPYKNPVLCQVIKVEDQKPPNGHYVKISINGKGEELWGVTCESDSSSFAINNTDTDQAVKLNMLKIGDNTINVTQCSDAKCSNTGESFNKNFTLEKSGERYKATPVLKPIILKPFGEICQVDPGKSMFFQFETK